MILNIAEQMNSEMSDINHEFRELLRNFVAVIDGMKAIRKLLPHPESHNGGEIRSLSARETLISA